MKLEKCSTFISLWLVYTIMMAHMDMDKLLTVCMIKRTPYTLFPLSRCQIL